MVIKVSENFCLDSFVGIANETAYNNKLPKDSLK